LCEKLEFFYKKIVFLQKIFKICFLKQSMIFPISYEQKIGFDKIRILLKEKCVSTLGSDCVNEMQFETNRETILDEVERTAEFIKISSSVEEFPIHHFIDVRPALMRIRIEGVFMDVFEIYDLKRSLENIHSILKFFNKANEENMYPRLKALTGDVRVYPAVIDKLNLILTPQGTVKDTASPDLHHVRKSMGSLQQVISKRMTQILKEAQKSGWIDTDTGVTIRDGKMLLPIPVAYKRKIKGIVHDESASGKTAFVEPLEIVEMNNNLHELEFQERREIVKILVGFADFIRPLVEDLLHSFYFLGKIDFTRAKALFSITVKAIVPSVFNDAPILKWENALHPLLFLRLHCNLQKIVPLNISLNHENRILLISGPNAGGKSVCLKTVGLLQYMWQNGLPVPVSLDSEMGIFEDIFIDIGDEQSIENDLSTYSSHLTCMKYFTENCNEKSLILIDEFGSGTEPVMGGALAEAILQKLNETKTKGVVTTHYSNLKHFASSTTGIVNGAMLFDIHKFQPLYKLNIGEAGSSFAYEIARNIGLSTDVLELATQKAGKQHIDYENSLRQVVESQKELENQRKIISQLEKELESKTEQYQKELAFVMQQRQTTFKLAKEQAQDLINEANRKIETTIAEIRKNNAEKEKTKEIRKEFETFKEDFAQKQIDEEERINRKIESIRQKQQERELKKFEKRENTDKKQEVVIELPLAKGDQVRIKGQQTVGEIAEIKGKDAVIHFGMIKTTVKIDKLERVSKKELKSMEKGKEYSQNYVQQTVINKKLNFRPYLDVRGMRGEEALQTVQEFVDEAIVVNAHELKILHGTGNGILRQLIRQYLNTVDVVKTCKDEHVQFGGAGISIVTMEY